MYSTCLFCNRPLGENAVIESFPVGRRLAFDAEKGRLWVVCGRCERWNLSPLEERWEAIEDAERLFRDTRMRVSTENIGLARHPEGLELVRIGRPLRPEFAAWRYGDQFGRRRRRAILTAGGALAALGTVVVLGTATGVLPAALLSQSGNFISVWINARTVVRLPTADGKVLKLRQPDLASVRLLAGPDGGMAVAIGRKKKERVFTGEEATRAASVILPRLNAGGARRTVVQESVREIELAGGPESYLHSIITDVPLRNRTLIRGDGPATQLTKLPSHARFALEMALHEEQERRALEGDLEQLEAAWRAAEEIAAISDDLLVPVGVRERLGRG